MKHLIPAVLAFVAAPLLAEEFTLADIATLPAIDVVYLGELHDNPWHHENQSAAVSALAPKAIVFEMLTREQARLITRPLLDDADALAKTLNWAQSGWPDFAMYYPIFQAAPNAQVYGAQVPREAVREAIMGGDVVASFGAEVEEFGLAVPLTEDEQAQREDEQFAAHCDALPREMLPGMVLGQRLRDATMAREISRALAETGGPVVVITGNGHARKDWGAPRLLDSSISQISIAQFEVRPETDRPFDHWIITPEATREDPCLAFQ
ncbi:ChaN family lipoprotein [uncultured Shimia sp.]|uniref:ChaN family lipoprotein n=1 Tax=uncultured Shimia sp. TaxID=573152 RepID=UPI0026100D0B|nr:ChaN family lipoprotein [uncultured Shimia sp.]